MDHLWTSVVSGHLYGLQFPTILRIGPVMKFCFCFCFGFVLFGFCFAVLVAYSLGNTVPPLLYFPISIL